ncbi:MAG: hypothetical protein ABI904_08410 [Chloroflexota bacterium]
MKRIPWDILLALLLGLGLGLAYSWVISPLRVVDADPIALRTDFKDAYRSAIASSYAATGNLPRAQARLALLGDTNSIDTLNSQAQRLIASGEFKQADQLAALAMALEDGGSSVSVPTSTSSTAVAIVIESTATLPPPPPDIPFQFTETPQVIETQNLATQAVVNTPTPRPTRTLIPTVGAPFALIAQDTVCDSNLPDGLLQVFIFNSNRRQVTGAKIIITWDNGEEQFFTGLKPEVGNGYADYSMSPNIIYTLRLAIGSDVASGLTAPTCQTPSGETFLGGIKLTFQQP